MTWIPLLTLVAVLLLVAVRSVGGLRLGIWQIMAAGAVTVLVTGAIGPAAAVRAIDANVMGFLFGVFVIGHALEASGALAALAHRLFRGAASTGALVARLLVGAGLASALLMNDTLAVIGTPVALALARRHGIRPQLLLLTLAFAVTLGSVPSPIGNPQNLLIAIHGGMATPFAAFPAGLLLPTLVNLAVAYGVLRLAFRREFRRLMPADGPAPAPTDPALARLASAALVLLVTLIAARALLSGVHPGAAPPLGALAPLACLPLLVASPRRREIVAGIDWHTLVFFAALFVLMASVWDTGILQGLLARHGLDTGGTATVLLAAAGASQLISNVPLVALYLPVLHTQGAGTPALLALAAGSTVAGNLLILGAASNVIVVQNAERRGVHLDFAAFARVGIPLTVLNLAVYWLALAG